MATFVRACAVGDLEAAQRIWRDQRIEIEVIQESTRAFWEACMSGHLHVAKWLHDDLGAVNLNAWGEGAFRWACAHGRLEVAKWLHGLGGMYSPASVMKSVFQHACKHGDLQVAQWLLQLGGVDIHEGGDEAFRAAVQRLHPRVAWWLVGLQPDWAWPAPWMEALL